MKFEKVSFEKIISDEARNYYNELSLPKRATVGSAGYDFYIPYNVTINPGEHLLIETCIRCKMESGYVLLCFPRSGLGSKKGLRIRNTVGVIDSDYYFADNEGHIMAMLENTSDTPIELTQGQAFMQGVFVQYFITEDDEVETLRKGGMGSTDK